MEELRILNGLNRGVAFPFFEESIVIGSSMESDILIPDPGVCGMHAKFVRNPDTNEVRVEALEGDLEDDLGEPIASKTLVSGQKVNLNGVWIGLSGEEAVWDSHEPSSKNQASQPTDVTDTVNNQPKVRSILPLVLLGGSALVLTVGFKTMAFANIENWDKRIDIEIENVSQEGVVINNEIKAPGTKDIRDLEYTFKGMLRDRELNDVTLDIRSDRWVISGQLSDKDKSKLERMLSRFLAQHNPHFSIDNQTILISKTLPFKLVSIVSGPFGHVITDTGERVSIGGYFQGYHLTEVSNNRIVFTGQKTVEVSW